MTRDQVVVGRTYNVKVSGTVQPVRLIGESPYGGWDGLNTRTMRKIRIRTAAKLRGEFRCGKCPNCLLLASERPTYQAKLHAVGTDTAEQMDQRLAVRQEWSDRATQLHCTGGRQ